MQGRMTYIEVILMEPDEVLCHSIRESLERDKETFCRSMLQPHLPIFKE